MFVVGDEAFPSCAFRSAFVCWWTRSGR